MPTYSASVGGNQSVNGLYHSIGAVFVEADGVEAAKSLLRAHGVKRGLLEGTVTITCLSLEWGSPDIGGELKGCPFCGSGELENLDAAVAGAPVHCIKCGARGPCRLDALEIVGSEDGPADGLEAWNVRAL